MGALAARINVEDRTDQIPNDLLTPPANSSAGQQHATHSPEPDGVKSGEQRRYCAFWLTPHAAVSFIVRVLCVPRQTVGRVSPFSTLGMVGSTPGSDRYDRCVSLVAGRVLTRPGPVRRSSARTSWPDRPGREGFRDQRVVLRPTALRSICRENDLLARGGAPTGEGKVCLCAIRDVYSDRIVVYSISDRMKSKIAMESFSPCRVRTSRTADGGPLAPSSGWRSSPGSNAPTTVADARTTRAG